MPTPETFQLRLLSLTAGVTTDVPEVAAYGRDLFHRFLDRQPGDPAYRLEILAAEEGYRIRDGLLDAVVADRSWLPGILAARLLEQVGNEARNHDVFHGAALSRGERGLIVCGESGHGKSTLTLALLRRGFGFLSDECAAVTRTGTATLHAFPKALEVRPGSPALEGLPDPGPARRGIKRIVDPEDWFPGCLRESAPLAAVVFLHSGDSAEQPPRELQIVVHRRVEELPASLQELDGIESARWIADAPDGPTLELCCDRETVGPAVLEEALAAEGVLILGSSADVAPPADFDREPFLEALPLAAGVQALLGQFRGRRAFSRRLEEHDGYPGLFLAMLERFAAVRFRSLRVGRLEPSVELLETLLSEDEPA